MTFTIKGNILSDGDMIENGFVTIDGGVIQRVDARPPSGLIDLDRTGFLVASGFIDMHVHGGAGVDFMAGTEDSVRAILRAHARHGTTGLLATTITASRADVDQAIRAICAVAEAPAQDEARILGIHLEGPYLCRGRRGAQPVAPIRPPDIDELRHWVELSNGRIRQITLAPELAGAIPFISAARELGITCSIGHTDATSAQALEAIEAGATQATHLFNAMRGLHHREPGAAGAALTSPQLVAELICDGVHLDPRIVRLAVMLKSVRRIALVTDAMSACDMPEGVYSLGGQEVISDGTKAAFRDGTLAGSTLTMERAFANVQRFASVGPADAATMAATVPARQIGVASRKGWLGVGRDADIVIIDPVDEAIDTTIVEGITAYQR
ncbi:MAG: N-acetylglucosamine-6-phosphate deacetylase [Capsulimonadaceae bacterium]|nr:N-acetylglucosamine-6-phosphate deacetylase [Capsulimonadaceae bacterium]